MKISVCTIAFRKEEIEKVIKKLASYNIDGVEIWGNHIQEYIKTGGKLSNIKELCENLKLEIPVISPYFNFTGTEEEFNNSIKIAKEFVHYALELEAPIIRAFVSNVGSKKATPYQWNQCVAGIKYICDFARSKDIIFAIETHPNQLMDNVDMTLELLHRVNKSNLKVILDIWHMFNEGESDPLEALERLYSYIVHIHAKNMKRESMEWVYMEDGDMNYKPFWDALKKKGYDRFISIEWFGNNQWEAISHEVEYLKKVLK